MSEVSSASSPSRVVLTGAAPEEPAGTGSEFDPYAEHYGHALAQGISVSGETKDYFARARVDWLRKRLAARGEAARCVLDFGCGTGCALPYFLELLAPERLLGVDISRRSLAVAARDHVDPRVSLHLYPRAPFAGAADVAFCNGVFHHIPLPERAAAVAYVRAALRPGGLFAFCENNPWNPGTQLVMSRIAFDRDAVKVSIPAARRLLVAGGFEVLSVDTLFYFPAALRFLRGLEPALAALPLGAQYMMLARRPA
jgi:SAM-dependent methyltransferase